MVTRGGVYPAAFAIGCFQRQSYANRELVIVCDQPDSPLKAWLDAQALPGIRYIEVPPTPLGTLRNASVAAARGTLLAQWDDDDLYHPDRLTMQQEALGEEGAAASFLHRWLLWWPARRWLAISGKRVWEGSMLARREGLPSYPALARGEDTEMVRLLHTDHAIRLTDQPATYCYIVHGHNSCDSAHMETLFAAASMRFEDAGYDGELARLDSVMPVVAYARWLNTR
jgi:Glycosyl transferase family 2